MILLSFPVLFVSQPQQPRFQAPLRDFQVSSSYGYRIHPVTGKREFHAGIDLISSDMNVYAAGPGVTVVGETDTDGKRVVIVHENGYQTFYSHLSKVYVRSGAIVKAGQVIGKMGNTGEMSDGIHLHFAMILNGRHVNPYFYIIAMTGGQGRW